MPKKILFINQEITPYIPESPMSVLGKTLPEAFQSGGYEIRTFMPKWGTINERRGQLHEVIRLSGLNIAIDNCDHPLLIKVASLPVSRVQVYFIDNDDFFTRRQMERDENGEEYADNGERAIFYARGVLETMKKLRWTPDVVVCQGWMSSVVPLYLKTVFAEEPCFADVKVVTCLYGSDLKGNMPANFKECLALDTLTAEDLSAYNDVFNHDEMAKMAIDHSDAVVAATENVSDTLMEYARAKELPIMNYNGEDPVEAYKAFFDSLA